MSSVLTGSSTPASDPVEAVEADASHSEPASVFSGTVAEELAVLVAPATGRFRPVGDPVGRSFERGALLGHVTGGKGRADAVHAPVRAAVADLLVRPGQLVQRGQALAWLRRAPGELPS